MYKKQFTFKKHDAPAKWEELLMEALNNPGKISDCYHMFYNYSFGNQMAAMWQIKAKKLPLGPIATFRRWNELGRKVISGPGSAIVLCKPYVKKIEDEKDPDNPKFKTYFNWEARWFTLAQTEGKEFTEEAFKVPDWDKDKALEANDIQMTPFESLDGNTQGYAFQRNVAINPLAKYPIKTLFHEMAHVILDHTDVKLIDSLILERNIKEVEAECTAYLCMVLLKINEDPAESRGYIQHWLQDYEFTEENAHRIFKAVNKILNKEEHLNGD